MINNITTFRTGETCVLSEPGRTVTLGPKGKTVILNRRMTILEEVTPKNLVLVSRKQTPTQAKVFFKSIFIGAILKEGLLWRLPKEYGAYLNPDPWVVAIALTKALVCKDWEILEPILCSD